MKNKDQKQLWPRNTQKGTETLREEKKIKSSWPRNTRKDTEIASRKKRSKEKLVGIRLVQIEASK